MLLSLAKGDKPTGENNQTEHTNSTKSTYDVVNEDKELCVMDDDGW